MFPLHAAFFFHGKFKNEKGRQSELYKKAKFGKKGEIIRLEIFVVSNFDVMNMLKVKVMQIKR
jgi:hypothetical protein